MILINMIIFFTISPSEDCFRLSEGNLHLTKGHQGEALPQNHHHHHHHHHHQLYSQSHAHISFFTAKTSTVFILSLKPKRMIIPHLKLRCTPPVLDADMEWAAENTQSKLFTSARLLSILNYHFG